MEASPDNIKESNGIPDQYFYSFRHKMEEMIKADVVRSELQKLAPGLSRIEKKEIYEAPAFYFESFRKNMLERPEVQNAKRVTVFEQFNFWIEKIADCLDKNSLNPLLAGGLSFSFVFMIYFTETSSCVDLDCRLATVSNHEIDLWLELENDVMVINGPEQELIHIIPAEEEFEKVLLKELSNVSDHELFI